MDARASETERKDRMREKAEDRVTVLTATDDCGCVGGVRQLDPRDHGARREPLQVRWPVQTRTWTQVPPSKKSTYVENTAKKTNPRTSVTPSTPSILQLPLPSPTFFEL
ncbi:hypothetical protein HZH68_003390 [Vespula germanica]|uniref:Uncharacterized protein n=1 Tax=Vespula germanica TaxID=30212 RepID=A0A834NP95_VESGE|nr:hypothetical protein HZH68_003390 [Vespula germanica]